jgi:dienelactone hydrolase
VRDITLAADGDLAGYGVIVNGRLARGMLVQRAAAHECAATIRRWPMFPYQTQVLIPVGGIHLAADLAVPDRLRGLVILGHGSDADRHCRRTQTIARWLEMAGMATLVADLLTPEEVHDDRTTGHLRDDVALFGRRLAGLIDWAGAHGVLGGLTIGLVGVGLDAAAALAAAAMRPHDVAAVVTGGGRLDPAGPWLSRVAAPTLMLVGGLDADAFEQARWARRLMHAPVEVDVVHDAGPRFDEPGPLEQTATRASEWLATHLATVPVGLR